MMDEHEPTWREKFFEADALARNRRKQLEAIGKLDKDLPPDAMASWQFRKEVRAVLDASPVDDAPQQTIDPAALDALLDREGDLYDVDLGPLGPKILALVRPVPPQGIDRDALLALLRQVWSRDRTVDDAEVRILALVRPA